MPLPRLPLLLLAVGLLGLVLTPILITGAAVAWNGTSRPPMGPHASAGRKDFATNGERIYFTGVSARTGPIPFRGGPPWMFTGAGCVACHGEDGTGGDPIMRVSPVPPDIRYETLTEDDHHDHGHPPYTGALIGRAITDGVDPAGRPLSADMPRWSLTDEDLDDLIEFLKVLGTDVQAP